MTPGQGVGKEGESGVRSRFCPHGSRNIRLPATEPMGTGKSTAFLFPMDLVIIDSNPVYNKMQLLLVS
ncbi:hypothetical protein NDU88_006276 [Pleurodeles waltl]|uniref:Uncharacterized protein n=1 Tax=Pleurodeles waltl TaxID=8319 RepID=A0AAV7TD16_PLEWA|nr:hypothetical protein NDU88_006276 [Pleurodeles waltl]